MHHAAAEQFDPARVLAQWAAGSVTALALRVEFGGGLRVRKEARPESRPHAGAEEALGERIQRALEVAQTDALVYDEAFDLGEHRRVRGVDRVAPVHTGRPHHRTP